MANQITITGALGRAPSLNHTQSGKAAWGLSLGYTPSKKNDNGTFEDTGPTLWFDVTVWGEDAEDLAGRYAGVERGRVTVTGRLASKVWTNKDGIDQTQMTITADAVTIHPPKQQQGYGSQQQGQQGGWQNEPQATFNTPKEATQARQAANATPSAAPSGGGWGNSNDTDPPF